MRIQPLEYGELKDAVVRAITLGYRRDMEEEDREIDLGLQELNEKKQRPGISPNLHLLCLYGAGAFPA